MSAARLVYPNLHHVGVVVRDVDEGGDGGRPRVPYRKRRCVGILVGDNRDQVTGPVPRRRVPTVTRYDHAAHLAVLEAHGEVTREEAVAQIRAACTELADLHARQPELPPYGVLIDTRQATTVPTAAGIVSVLDEIAKFAAALSSSRWAILATEPAHYGMGRLFGTYAEGRGIEARVFTTYDSAVTWLGATR